MAEFIKKTDTLNEGREKINAAIQDAEDAKTIARQAENVSEQAKQIAQTAENKADNVQEQFNQVVIEGDSSVEAAQARVDADGNTYTTLKERLDTKEQLFSAQLADNTNKIGILTKKIDYIANVKEFGAKGDGVTDDAPKIRDAIAKLKDMGGGVLLFPPGIYYLASGDPRGMSGDGVFQKNDFYTVFELLPNMIICGVGKGSKLLYESNRLGYHLSTLRGDLGAIFANLRVTGTTSTSSYAVDGVVIMKDIEIEYTPLVDGEKDVRDYLDGQVIRAYSKNNTLQNGHFYIENVNVYNAPSSQLFSIENCKSFTARNCNFYNVGKASNAAIHDHSSFYVNGDRINIDGCTVKTTIDDDKSTAIELHGKHCTVTNNYVDGMSIFLNAVGNTDLNDGSTFHVYGNKVRNVITFVNGWVYAKRKTNVIDISNNEFYARATNNKMRERFFIWDNDNGDTPDTMLSIDLVRICNNYAETLNIDNAPIISTSADADTTYDSFIRNDFVSNWEIMSNHFKNIRRQAVNITGTRVRRAVIKENELENIGVKLPDSAANTAKAGIYYNIPQLGAFNPPEFLDISNNHIIMSAPTTSSDSSGIYINVRTAQTFNDKDFKIENNIIKGATREIQIYNKATDGIFNNSFLLKHKVLNYNDTTLTAWSALLLGYNSDISGLKVGSKIEVVDTNGNLITVEINQTNSYRITGFSTAPPTSKYWKKGSIVINTSPSAGGYYGWVCIADGTPGTWKGFGEIQT